MSVSNALVFLLQTSFLLVVALVVGLSVRKAPAFRLAIVRLAIVAVLALALGSPWLGERANPVVPVEWAPTTEAVAPTPVTTVVQAQVASSPAAASSTTSGLAVNPLALATGVWLAGAGVLALHLAVGFFGLVRIRRACRPVENPDVLRVLEETSKAAGVRTPAVLQGDLIGNPFVAGLLTPTVFLPNGWHREVDEETLRAVLRHEVAHIANGDLRWNLLHRLTCVALWPQPLLWLLKRPMQSACEELCDRHVLASGIPSATYAKCLLNLRESLRARPCPSLGIGAVSSLSSLGARVEAIMDSGGSRAVRLPRLVSAALRVGVVAVVASAAFLFARPVAAQQGDSLKGWAMAPYAAQIKILSPEGKPVLGAKAFLSLTGRVPRTMAYPLKVEGNEIAVDPTDLPGETTGTLVVKGPGYGIQFVALWPTPRPVKEVRLPEAVALQGRLLLPDGQPAAGLVVDLKMLVRKNPGPVTFEFVPELTLRSLGFETKTGADGTFRIEGLGPKVQVAYDVKDDAYAQLKYDDRVLVGTSLTQAKTVTLAPAARLRGTVTRDGKPVIGLHIGAQPNTDRDSSPDATGGDAITDSEGHFSIERMPAGIYNIAADLQVPLGKDVTAAGHEGVVVKAGQEVDGLTFELIPGVIIEGHVKDAAGKPMANTDVGVYGPAHPKSSAWVQMARTDAIGKYRLRVPPGEQYVYVMDGRYQSTDRTIGVQTGSATVNFTVTPRPQETGDIAPAAKSDATEEEIAKGREEDAERQRLDSAPTPPVVSFGPGRPFYGPFTLRSRARIRLAYVQSEDNPPHTIWKPDGSSPDRADVARSLNMEATNGAKRNPRPIFLRLDVDGLERGEYNIRVQVPHHSSWSVWQTYGDTEDRTMDMASFRAPETLQVTDMRVGIASMPYRLAHSLKIGQGPLFAKAGGKGGVSISFLVPKDLEGMDLRLDAYDRAGKAMELISYSDSEPREKDGFLHQIFTFSSGDPSDVDHIELMARPIEWVTFKGIHLYPNRR